MIWLIAYFTVNLKIDVIFFFLNLTGQYGRFKIMSNTAVDYASQCTQCKAVTSGKLVYRKYILGKLIKTP